MTIVSIITAMLIVGSILILKQAIVGVVLGADGSTPASGRQAKTGEAVVTVAHGEYYEAASRGSMFVAGDQAAGVATTTSISTVSIYSLYNPVQSGKRLEICAVAVGYFSGTLGAGTIYHCLNGINGTNTQTTAPSGGTALTILTTDSGNQSGVKSVASAGTGTSVVAPLVAAPLVDLGAALASTAAGLRNCFINVEGLYVIEPGCCYQLQSVCASGSTPKISVAVYWQEVQIAATNG